jgi:hypothetical protein
LSKKSKKEMGEKRKATDDHFPDESKTKETCKETTKDLVSYFLPLEIWTHILEYVTHRFKRFDSCNLDVCYRWTCKTWYKICHKLVVSHIKKLSENEGLLKSIFLKMLGHHFDSFRSIRIAIGGTRVVSCTPGFRGDKTWSGTGFDVSKDVLPGLGEPFAPCGSVCYLSRPFEIEATHYEFVFCNPVRRSIQDLFGVEKSERVKRFTKDELRQLYTTKKFIFNALNLPM